MSFFPKFPVSQFIKKEKLFHVQIPRHRVNIAIAQADKVSKRCRVENQQVGVMKKWFLVNTSDGPYEVESTLEA